jgi:hypothetical protein
LFADAGDGVRGALFAAQAGPFVYRHPGPRDPVEHAGGVGGEIVEDQGAHMDVVLEGGGAGLILGCDRSPDFEYVPSVTLDPVQGAAARVGVWRGARRNRDRGARRHGWPLHLGARDWEREGEFADLVCDLFDGAVADCLRGVAGVWSPCR